MAQIFASHRSNAHIVKRTILWKFDGFVPRFDLQRSDNKTLLGTTLMEQCQNRWDKSWKLWSRSDELARGREPNFSCRYANNAISKSNRLDANADGTKFQQININKWSSDIDDWAKFLTSYVFCRLAMAHKWRFYVPPLRNGCKKKWNSESKVLK